MLNEPFITQKAIFKKQNVLRLSFPVGSQKHTLATVGLIDFQVHAVLVLFSTDST